MRLDIYLFEKGYYTSRTKAEQATKKGQVLVNGKAQKSSYLVKDGDDIQIAEKQKFVSLGGYKLEKALDSFCLDVANKVYVDVGASTGGFTDCLIKRGAKKVYALDVGTTQLDSSLLLDDRVVVVDNTNARFVDENTLPEKVDGAVVDCSFISLSYILQPILSLIKDDGFVIALIKPQFECGKSNLTKRGLVITKSVHKEVCFDVYDYASSLNLSVLDFTYAPIVSGKNIEFLIKLARSGKSISKEEISAVIDKIGD